jgi:hypothetical protein
MKIIEFDEKGQRVERDSRSIRSDIGSSLAPRPALKAAARAQPSSESTGIELYMFQTGTLRTKLKYIKMNQGEEDFEIPVPWFLIKHPAGNIVIDGGNAIETAIDKHGHWGAVVDAYDPIMDVADNCVDQCKSVFI